jgi:LCP family protein required for cell wall assembly
MIRRAVVVVLALALVAFGVPLIGSSSRSVAAPDVIAGRVHENFQPKTGKMFVLVIGNDARAGNPDSARADAIHIVGINTKTMKGGILNFPRDSWVSIPGYGSARINEALIAGGPQRLAQTLERMTGIRIDYWVMTGFEGFRAIMKELHGAELRIDRRLYDPSGSGVNLRPGKQWLAAETSLAFVRTRHSFPSGDVARTTNQGRFLLALLRKFRDKSATNPGVLMRWVSVARRHTRLNISAGELFRLGVLASQVKAKDVGNVTVPVSGGSVGAASVVFISSRARDIYRRFRKNGSL